MRQQKNWQWNSRQGVKASLGVRATRKICKKKARASNKAAAGMINQIGSDAEQRAKLTQAFFDSLWGPWLHLLQRLHWSSPEDARPNRTSTLRRTLKNQELAASSQCVCVAPKALFSLTAAASRQSRIPYSRLRARQTGGPAANWWEQEISQQAKQAMERPR